MCPFFGLLHGNLSFFLFGIGVGIAIAIAIVMDKKR